MNARRVKKPWGYELHWAVTERYVGKILHINAGHALSLQYHTVKDETIRVLSGLMLLEIGDRHGRLRKRTLKPGAAVHITPFTRHRMTAMETCDVLEVSTPELDDVVREEDRYGRAGDQPDADRGKGANGQPGTTRPAATTRTARSVGAKRLPGRTSPKRT